MSLIVDGLLPEGSHEQEEPDSAFEATQYFFEDITPDTSMGETSYLYNRLVICFPSRKSFTAANQDNDDTFVPLFLFLAIFNSDTLRSSCNNIKPSFSVY